MPSRASISLSSPGKGLTRSNQIAWSGTSSPDTTTRRSSEEPCGTYTASMRDPVSCPCRDATDAAAQAVRPIQPDEYRPETGSGPHSCPDRGPPATKKPELVTGDKRLRRDSKMKTAAVV